MSSYTTILSAGLFPGRVRLEVQVVAEEEASNVRQHVYLPEAREDDNGPDFCGELGSRRVYKANDASEAAILDIRLSRMCCRLR